jgi:hypothetical protein
MANEISIVKRRPFSSLAEPHGKSLAELKRLTLKGVNYRAGCSYVDGDLLDVVSTELKLRSKKGTQVRFLDAGSGRGKGVVLAESISPVITAHGLALHDSDPALGIPAHKWTKGHFEVNVFQKPGLAEGAFDVIQSRYGLQHAANQAMSLENLLNSLKVGGKLFNFHDSDKSTVQIADTGMVEALERQGFVLQKSRLPALFKKICDRVLVNSPKLFVITRTSARMADLSGFYGSARINKVPLRKGNPNCKYAS